MKKIICVIFVSIFSLTMFSIKANAAEWSNSGNAWGSSPDTLAVENTPFDDKGIFRLGGDGEGGTGNDGAGNDNEQGYNDVPVGDAIPFMLVFAFAYGIYIYKRQNKISKLRQGLQATANV
ncbi:MAG: hypothetical protein LBV31_03705 [Prevotellaceae bacterium]|jgi:hypothetical protein|nr:hypothetical protein [Prevotellaceae bacterium]